MKKGWASFAIFKYSAALVNTCGANQSSSLWRPMVLAQYWRMISAECSALGPPTRVFSIFFSDAGVYGTPRQDRRQRLGVRAVEDEALLGESIEVGGLYPIVPVDAEVVPP